MVVTAGVLPEGKQSLAMPAVGGTLLGQEKGGVPKLIWDCILISIQQSLQNCFSKYITEAAHQLLILRIFRPPSSTASPPTQERNSLPNLAHDSSELLLFDLVHWTFSHVFQHLVNQNSRVDSVVDLWFYIIAFENWKTKQQYYLKWVFYWDLQKIVASVVVWSVMGGLEIYSMINIKTHKWNRLSFGCQYLTMTEDRLEVAQSSRFGTDGLVKEVLVKHLQVQLILFISFIGWYDGSSYSISSVHDIHETISPLTIHHLLLVPFSRPSNETLATIGRWLCIREVVQHFVCCNF